MRIAKIWPAAALVMGATLAGCDMIWDDPDDCLMEYKFKVNAYISGSEANARVGDVTIYLFDEQDLFVEKITAQAGEELTLDVPSEGLYAVAWGNLGGGRENAALPAVGTPMGQCTVNLQQMVTAPTGSYVTPDNLFFGTLDLTQENLATPQELRLNRIVGSMTVRLKNFREFAGFSDNLSVRIGGASGSTISFAGMAGGGAATYFPAGTFGSDGTWTAPEFYMLPGSGLTIGLYHYDDLITTARYESDGTPLSVNVNGGTTDVLIELGATIDVSVTEPEWDEDYDADKEF